MWLVYLTLRIVIIAFNLQLRLFCYSDLSIVIAYILWEEVNSYIVYSLILLETKYIS